MVERFLEEEKAEKTATEHQSAGYQEETARVEVRPRPGLDVFFAVERELVPKSLVHGSSPMHLAPCNFKPDHTQDGLNNEEAKPQSPVVEQELKHTEKHLWKK